MVRLAERLAEPEAEHMTIRIADFYKRRLIIEALLRYSYDLSKRPNGEALQRDILDLAWEIDDRLALVVEAELIHERTEDA